MNPRLSIELACRRHPRSAWLGLAALLILPAIALTGLATPAPAPATVAAIDPGSRSEAHFRDFRAQLISPGQLEARQSAVLEQALRHGLTPGRIDYGNERSEAGRFDRATLAVPLRGSYADLRGFLNEVLARDPMLGITELTLQRDTAGSGIIAQLRLSFHTLPAEDARP